jgi:hypothetical protein
MPFASAKTKSSLFTASLGSFDSCAELHSSARVPSADSSGTSSNRSNRVGSPGDGIEIRLRLAVKPNSEAIRIGAISGSRDASYFT